MRNFFDKRKINRWCVKNITQDLIKSAVLFILSAIILGPKLVMDGIDIGNIVDTGIILSFLAVAICSLLANILLKFIISKTEDAMKISDNYDELVKKYCLEDMFKFKKYDNKIISFPEILLAYRKINETPFNIVIDNSNKDNRYQLPKQIADNSSTLFEAHSASIIYNNINIRIDDLEYSKDKNIIKLLYSKTTYFDSLLTNRAMDYPFKRDRTVREVFEPGPLLSTLSESKLSNHIGFNGFIETADGFYIFVKRSKNLSIAKNMLSTSVSASLKTKYALIKDRKLTLEGISNAIKKEILDELKIDVDIDAGINTDLSQSIFAFYRELAEGGKPQFLMHYKLKRMKKDEVKNNFIKSLNENSNDKRYLTEDGREFKFYTLNELKESKIGIELLTIQGKDYQVVPTVSFSVACLLSCI